MRKILLVLVAFLFVQHSFSQDFSNKGKEFWVGYGYHQGMISGNVQEMVLYFATDQVTTVTVSIPGTGYTATYTIPANTVFSTPAAGAGGIPKSGAQDARLLNTEGITNKGIHIVANKPIIAYAHIYNSSVSGATILYPTNTLGKEYYSVNYTNNSNSANSNCWFYVVATEPGTTTVEITPSANTIGGWVAGNTYTVNLTQGQIYNVLGTYGTTSGVDLTGSKIKSIASGTGVCKKIAVYSGSGRIAISCNASSPSSDNYMSQALPKNAWGKKYLTVPSANYTTTTSNPTLVVNYLRVCVLDPTTVVTVNGTALSPALLQGNFYYQLGPSAAPQKIEADKPIMVAQYFPSQGAGGCAGIAAGDGDPEVIYLSPVEQSISAVNWNACSNFAINSNKHYINVVIPNTGTAISSFKLDGVSVAPSSFTTHPQDAGYSYAVLKVSGIPASSGPGVPHTVTSDSGFNAIAYGYGAAESYGYNAGTNIKDLFQQIKIQTQYGIEETPSICTGTSFKFKISLPYKPTQIVWDLSGLPGGFPNVTQLPSPSTCTSTCLDPTELATNVCPDSCTVINGKTIYWYSLPTNYNVATTGTYPVTITTQSNNLDGCGTEQEISFDLSVVIPPVPGFTFTPPGCPSDPVSFTDATVTSRPNYKWYWDFNDPTSGAANYSAVQNPTHIFSTPGNHVVRFSSTTTPGCVSDTLERTIFVPDVLTATATVTNSGNTCQNTSTPPTITFTGTGGVRPYTFNYNINGGTTQTIASDAAGVATITPPVTATGTNVYNLLGIQNQGASASACAVTFTAPAPVSVTVYPLPTATISASATAVCQNSTAVPVITFTGAGGTAPYTFNYTINGAAQTPIVSTGNTATVNVVSTTAGPQNFVITGVSDASPAACTNPITGQSVAVNVLALPTATISGSAAEVCSGTTAPTITFTGTGGTAPYTFTYNINGGANQTTTSTAPPLTVNTGTPGTYIYTLVSVQESSVGACVTTLPAGTEATVKVNPLPTGGFTVTGPYCEGKAVTFTPTGSVATGSIASWVWDYGDGTGSHTLTSSAPFTVTYATTGAKTATLKIVSDKGCESVVYTQNFTVGANPVAEFTLPVVCSLDPIAQFTDASTGSISTYLWDFGDAGATPGNPNTSNATNGAHTYSVPGSYTVTLTVTSAGGCFGTTPHTLVVNGAPVPDFVYTTPTGVCSGETVSIQNKSTATSGSVTKIEVYWDNTGQPTVFDADNTPTFDEIYNHTYPTLTTNQTYNVRMRVYTGASCGLDKIIPITVHGKPVVAFAAVPDVCLNNGTVQLTQGTQTISDAGPVNGTYSGTGVTPAGIFDPVAAGAGTHTITYTYTTTFGCTDSKTQTVKVLQAPAAVFSARPACAGLPVTFTQNSTSAEGTITSWIWNFEGTNETHSNGNAVTHTFAGSGPQTVTLTVVTADGCKSTVNSQIIDINPVPAPNFTFSPSACLPQASIVFNNTTPNLSNYTYNWLFEYPATSPSSSSVNPTHVYTAAGPYTVRLIASSTAGCSAFKDITVNTIHPAPLASFDFGADKICEGKSVNVINHSTPADGTFTNFIWDFGDSSPQVSGQNPTAHIYTSPNTYNVTLSVENSFGCKDDTVRAFKVVKYPTVDAGETVYVLEGGTSILQPAVTGTELSYLWTANPNPLYLSDATVANPVTSPVTDVIYTLTVTESGICSKSDDVLVKVLKFPTIPNTFTPNGDGIHDNWDIQYLYTYPNNRVQVFTRTGQLVFESKGYQKAWDGTMNGKSLPADTYYYIIEPGYGRKPITGFVTLLK